MRTHDPLSQHMVVRLFDSRGAWDIPVDLHWFPDDPYAICMEFVGRDIDWQFSRELLANGLRGPAGDGDVRIRPLDSHLIEVTLLPCVPGQSSATLLAPRADLEDFLSAVWTQLPAEATVHADLDRWLREVLHEQTSS